MEKKILQNIALFELNERCKNAGMDISDTYIWKVPRKWRYYLTKKKNHRALGLVVFSASEKPRYVIYEDSAYND